MFDSALLLLAKIVTQSDTLLSPKILRSLRKGVDVSKDCATLLHEGYIQKSEKGLVLTTNGQQLGSQICQQLQSQHKD